MTRHSGDKAMTDAEVRAELERIRPVFAAIFSHVDLIINDVGNVALNPKDLPGILKVLRLLAESQQALGEIVRDEIGGDNSHCPDCIRKRDIAKAHYKGEK